MQTPSVDQLVGQVLGNYRLERFLGKGRLNAVYLARELTSQRTDALALYLIPERFSIDARDIFLMRFRKEAAAITTLDHLHILPVYAYGEYGSYPYLVTPYMTQGSLADVLKRKGRCEHAFVQPILEQLVAGIAYAHGKGFIHGTLKPANVLLLTEDTMQVAGFGLMHMLQQRGIEPNAQPYTHLLSIADTFLAAPEYIAPEVVQGQAVDMRSDIYSLGCILFELLSGQPPFHGEKPLEVVRQHVTQTIPSLRKIASDVPVALSSVVHQALERDPAQRFQNVAELGEAFAQASRGATSYQKQRVGGSTDEVSRMYAGQGQDTPQEGYTAGNWQLRPPVVTGQVPVIKAPRPAAQASRTSTGMPDNWQLLPPIVTGRMPALKSSPAASAPPTLPPVVPQELPPPARPAPVVQQSPAKPVITPAPQATPVKRQSNSGNSMPGTNADTSDLVKAYEWWSLSDHVQAAPSAPVPANENGKRPPIEHEVDWTAEPIPLETTGRRKKQKSAQGLQKIQRRKVFAFIAAGSVAAAGAAVFLNFGHIVGTPATKPGNQKNAPAQTTQQQVSGNGKPTAQAPNQQSNNPAPTNNPTPPQNGQMNMQDAPAANGNTIGSTKQMGNSSAEFTNPADKKMALLIHLSSGSFAAYERACTHEGVNVNYDPATKMLICPAHGAIFDPATNGSVVQGPAEQPLPAVHVKVNGDGTVTTV